MADRRRAAAAHSTDSAGARTKAPCALGALVQASLVRAAGLTGRAAAGSTAPVVGGVGGVGCAVAACAAAATAAASVRAGVQAAEASSAAPAASVALALVLVPVLGLLGSRAAAAGRNVAHGGRRAGPAASGQGQEGASAGAVTGAGRRGGSPAAARRRVAPGAAACQAAGPVRAPSGSCPAAEPSTPPLPPRLALLLPGRGATPLPATLGAATDRTARRPASRARGATAPARGCVCRVRIAARRAAWCGAARSPGRGPVSKIPRARFRPRPTSRVRSTVPDARVREVPP